MPLTPPRALVLGRPLTTTSSTLYVGAGADGSYTGFVKLSVVPLGGGLLWIFKTPYWASVVSICNNRRSVEGSNGSWLFSFVSF